MLTVGGLLLGAVLTAPGAVGGVASAEPVDPIEHRVVSAQGEGLRDPFAARPHAPVATGRRAPRPSDELRDPFAAIGPREPIVAPTGSAAELRSPFDRARTAAAPLEPAPPRATALAPAPLAPAPHVELRDPFGR